MTTNQSSNRNSLNAGSDTSHMRDTGAQAYNKSKAIAPSAPVRNTDTASAVGSRDNPGKGYTGNADPRSAVKG